MCIHLHTYTHAQTHTILGSIDSDEKVMQYLQNKTRILHDKTCIQWKYKLLSKHIGMLYLFLEILRANKSWRGSKWFLVDAAFVEDLSLSLSSLSGSSQPHPTPALGIYFCPLDSIGTFMHMYTLSLRYIHKHMKDHFSKAKWITTRKMEMV